MKNSSQEIAEVDQAGLGLPDRDYYLKTDAQSETLRKQYVAHVQKTFQLLGDSEPIAANRAKAVMRVETALATSSLDRVSRREPAKVYHKMPVRELISLTPSFGWRKYFRGVGAPSFDALNVAVPDFFKGMEKQIAATSMDDWKTYLTWHLTHAQSILLPAGFVAENFDFARVGTAFDEDFLVKPKRFLDRDRKRVIALHFCHAD